MTANTRVFAPEARTFTTSLQIRDVQTVGAGRQPRFLEGVAVPFDTWADLGWFLEQHAPDSFKRSTKSNGGQGLPLLLFHDNRTFPIGHAEEWSHTDALRGVWRLNDTPEAQRAAEAAEAGDMRGMSIGFQPKESQWDYVEDWQPDLGADHKDRVTRKESRLLEVSLTPTPAFEDAAVTLVRSAFDLATRSAMSHNRGAREVNAWREVRAALSSGISD